MQSARVSNRVSIPVRQRSYSLLSIKGRYTAAICYASRLQLRFVGNGDVSHLDDPNDYSNVASTIDLPEGSSIEAGRAETAEICIPIPTVSARHALFATENDECVKVTDLGSTNGTFIDGQKVRAIHYISYC